MKKLMSAILALLMVLSVASFAGAESEPIKLTWAMGTGDVAPIDNAMVLEELNKMSREAIGVECDIQYFTNDQIQLSIQSGEVYDIYYTCSWYNNFNQCVSQGLFANLDGKIEELAPDLYASMTEDVWALAHSADGGLYGIPVKKDYAIMNFITYPADIAAELGFEIPDSIGAWSELTDFLVAWKETLPENEYPVLVGGNPPGMESSFDFIDRTAMIGCVFGTTEVVSVFDDPAVMERYRTMADWYALGLVNPDAAQLTETSVDTTKERISFVQAWPGYDFSVSNGYNTEMTCYFWSQPQHRRRAGLHERALHHAGRRSGAHGSRPQIYRAGAYRQTVLRHHALWRAGLSLELCHRRAERSLRGRRAAHRSRHHQFCSPWGFSQPAYFFTSIEVSQAQVDGTAKAPVLNQYELYDEAIETSANVSAISGFTWDSSAWTQNLAEINAIKEEYYTDFATGTIPIDDIFEEFMGKMNDAGLQDMIADAQAQLDAYLESKGA